MNEEEIKDYLECIYGIDNVPKDMMALISSFKQRKSKFRPQPITTTDIAMLSVVYDFMVSMTDEAKERSEETDEAIALAEAAKEAERGQ